MKNETITSCAWMLNARADILTDRGVDTDDPKLMRMASAEIAALAQENARLREALRLIHDWRGLGDEDSLTTWERIAEDFRRDTGYLRPGKDYAAASGFNDEAGQRKAWETWCERKNAEVNTAIRTALRAGGDL